jgi:hypothetical protein
MKAKFQCKTFVAEFKNDYIYTIYSTYLFVTEKLDGKVNGFLIKNPSIKKIVSISDTLIKTETGVIATRCLIFEKLSK